MPRYNYICYDCLASLEQMLGREATDQERSVCVFETRHGFEPTTEELKEASCCPTCQSNNTKITLLGSDVTGFVRGVNWQEYRRNPANAAAIKREMDIHILKNNDPYGHMRQPGEAAELIEKLQKQATK